MLTAEEFDNYPFEEDKRYELGEGELIETEKPAYWHYRISGNLLFGLDRYLRNGRLGVLASPRLPGFGLSLTDLFA